MAPPLRRTLRRWLLPGLGLGTLALVAFAFASTGCGAAFGARATGPRLARMEASPNFGEGTFLNVALSEPRPHQPWKALGRIFDDNLRSPAKPLPRARPSASELAAPPASGLRVTWMGHSSVLLSLDGAQILFDPVWSERVSPVAWAGPKRFQAPPIPLTDLPQLQAVVISHDHYDHLDQPTIEALQTRTERFVVPLGIGAHLERWGVPSSKIVELDWWQESDLGAVTLVCTPAHHFSGRSLTDRNSTLWASWVVRGPEHRVYFGGDSGMFPGYAEIGEREGPFDLTLLPIGAYDEAWAEMHLNPEEALQAHRQLRGEVMLPIHWASFPLALHDWHEPGDRLLIAAAETGSLILTPVQGRPVELREGAPPLFPAWWRARGPLRVAGLD
ncbi:MAG: MBL fold metallo-hydrolase [Deltaproteobacteria bacterium]|nr:MBL fold metallo-hydrolase [Deltaproteobacteria bacterium]